MASGTLYHWVFEQPWLLAVAGVVLAVALGVVGLRRAHARMLGAAVAALVLAIGVVLLALWVTTDRERVLQRTEQLIMSTAPLNMNPIDAILEPSVNLTGPAGTPWLDGEQIRRVLPQVSARFGIAGQSLRQLEAEVIDSQRATSSFAVRTTTSDGNSISTTWLLTWAKDSQGGWRVAEIRWLKIQNHEPTEGMWN